VKKLLAIILAILTVLTLVTGCSKSEVETPAPSVTPTTTSVPVTTTTPAPAPTTTTPVPTTPTTVPPAPTTTTSVPEQPTTSPTTGIGEAEELPVYSWDEAEYHLGETAIVIGPVIEMERGQIGSCITYTLGVGKPVGHGSFLVDLGCQESPPEDIYTGHTISVTGYIVFNGYPGSGPSGARIVIDDLSQIEIIE
jgi:hypothetical protein